MELLAAPSFFLADDRPDSSNIKCVYGRLSRRISYSIVVVVNIVKTVVVASLVVKFLPKQK